MALILANTSTPMKPATRDCTVTASHLCTSRNTCNHQRSAVTATIAAAPPRQSSHARAATVSRAAK